MAKKTPTCVESFVEMLKKQTPNVVRADIRNVDKVSGDRFRVNIWTRHFIKDISTETMRITQSYFLHTDNERNVITHYSPKPHIKLGSTSHTSGTRPSV